MRGWDRQFLPNIHRGSNYSRRAAWRRRRIIIFISLNRSQNLLLPAFTNRVGTQLNSPAPSWYMPINFLGVYWWLLRYHTERGTMRAWCSGSTPAPQAGDHGFDAHRLHWR